MLLSVLAYSLLPIGIVVVGGTTSPFLMGASQTVGHIIAGITFLRVGHAPTFKNKRVQESIRKNLRTWAILFSALAPFTFAFLAWSAAYIDITASTIIWGSWPILLVLFLMQFSKMDDAPTSRPQKTTSNRASLGLWILMILGLLGLAFIVLSQSDSPSLSDMLAADTDLPLVGVAIAIGSALLGSFSAWHFRWADKVTSELSTETLAKPKTEISAPPRSYALFLVVACMVIGNCIACPILILISITSSETFSVGTMLGGFAIGFFIRTPATILWRMSNLATDNFGVNALNYLEPLMSILWLVLFWEIDISRVDYMIIGASAVFAANILINAEAEIGLGFKATIVMMWVSGTAIYFRDDRVLWTGDEYFSILALSATIFAVILAFRVTRIVSTTSEEDQWFFTIAMKLDTLSRQGKFTSNRSAIFDDLSLIDSTHLTHTIREPYSRILSEITSAQEALEPGSKEHSELNELAIRLNVFANSKQQAWNFGEFFSLCIFAILTVGLALLGQPETTGWTGYLVDMFTILFSSVIVFLIFNARDLQHDRYRPLLEYGHDGVQLVFHDPRDRSIERIVSVLIAAGIWLAFAYVLVAKWL